MSSRPTIEHLADGDAVLIAPKDPARDTGDAAWATVVDAGPEWIALTGGDSRWVMSRATQDDGTERFMTPEQLAWEMS